MPVILPSDLHQSASLAATKMAKKRINLHKYNSVETDITT